MKPKKLLIAGGLGFIGTALTRKFSKVCAVTVADRMDFGMSPGVEPLIEEGLVEFVETDLAEPSKLHERIREGEFDAIINAAALTHIPYCETYPDFACHSNVVSVLMLLSHLPASCKLIHFSTSSTYAPENRLHLENESPLVPCDFYGWTKKHAEDCIRYIAAKKNLTILGVRLANAAGYGETNPKLLGTILQQVHSGGGVVELGNLTPRRDFIHTDDIAWVLAALFDKWPVKPGQFEIFNVGTGYEPISVRELFEKIQAAWPESLRLKSAAERCRKTDRELLAVDIRKLKSVLPEYKPKRIEEWLPEIVLNPGLRISSRIEQMIAERTHAEQKR